MSHRCTPSSSNSFPSVVDQESFHKFFDCWLSNQSKYLEDLISVSKRPNDIKIDSIQSIINQVVDHYQHYYKVKSKWAKVDIWAMFSPSWTTSLEDAFLWIGGWRPSMAFHLLFSKSGLQLVAQLQEIIRGLSSNDLGDLSTSQLILLDGFHRDIIKEEREVTEKMAKLQETVADASIVELSHLASEIMRGETPATKENGNEKVGSALALKEEGLVQILEKADDLRMRTIKGIIAILSPIQAVHFLIAAAELNLRIHEWGKKRDAKAA